MEEKNGFDWGAVLAAFGFGFPLLLIFTPREIQKDLVESVGKLVTFVFVIGVAYFIWCVIKDKRKK